MVCNTAEEEYNGVHLTVELSALGDPIEVPETTRMWQKMLPLIAAKRGRKYLLLKLKYVTYRIILPIVLDEKKVTFRAGLSHMLCYY